MVRGQIAYKSHPRVLSIHHYRFQSENRQKGKRCRVSQSASFSLAFIQAIAVTTESVLPLYSIELFCCTLVRWERTIFDTRKYADYVT